MHHVLCCCINGLNDELKRLTETLLNMWSTSEKWGMYHRLRRVLPSADNNCCGRHWKVLHEEKRVIINTVHFWVFMNKPFLVVSLNTLHLQYTSSFKSCSCEVLHELFSHAGFAHYCFSIFALPSFQLLYNQGFLLHYDLYDCVLCVYTVYLFLVVHLPFFNFLLYCYFIVVLFLF